MLTENARAREEAERRIAAANRRMDHLERARREEEAPLLERAYQKKVPPPPACISACATCCLRSPGSLAAAVCLENLLVLPRSSITESLHLWPQSAGGVVLMGIAPQQTVHIYRLRLSPVRCGRLRLVRGIR